MAEYSGSGMTKGLSEPCKHARIGSRRSQQPQSDEIKIVRDEYQKDNPKKTVRGFHYMLTARTNMASVTFKGYLDNMAREAVAMQVRNAQTVTNKK